MTSNEKTDALIEMVDLIEELVQRRMLNCQESRQQSLEAITEYLQQTKEQ